jgi:23S rRNA pseudouridine1911/1915/1917 synthase
MKINIIFEDNNLLVVDKPAQMIVNRADTVKGSVTLQDWVEGYRGKFKNELSVEEKEKYMVNGYNKFDEFISRSGIVHRLDKETSGIILIAKNVETFMILQEKFKTHDVNKTYLALVHGKLDAQEGEIKEPIGRLPWNRTRFGILQEGRDAYTCYKVLQEKKYMGECLTLVEVYPKTGRTHQIRVHFQHINHPIFADILYAGRKTARNDRKVLGRHFLHAGKIEFTDILTSEKVVYESMLPEELASFLNTLESF